MFGLDAKTFENTDNKVLVHKVNCQDLTTHSYVIVDESQEVLFYKGGQALDLLGPGTHSLKTGHLPLVKGLIAKIFGGKTPFPITLYFIEKKRVLDLFWGTNAPVPVEDPQTGILANIRANGSMGIRVIDSRKFVLELVGQMDEITAESVRKHIKGQINTLVKSILTSTINDSGIGVLKINGHLDELSDMMSKKINARIADMGIQVVNFVLEDILLGDNDLEALQNANAEAYTMTRLSRAKKESRDIEGAGYWEERKMDILESAVKNEGSGANFMNMGVGLGVGAGVAGTVTNMFGNAMGGQQAQPQQAEQPQPKQSAGAAVCANCGAELPANAKFCMTCGTPRPQASFCPECGTKVEAGAKFCMNCGTKLG